MAKPPKPATAKGARPKTGPGAAPIVITIGFQPEFLAWIDAAADSIGDSRTSFIRHAVATYLRSNFPKKDEPGGPKPVIA